MRNTVVGKLGLYSFLAILILGLASPVFANTLPSHSFDPDRSVRNHRDWNPDSQGEGNGQDSWKTPGTNEMPGFRPERISRFDNDAVNLGPAGNDAPPPPNEDTPTAPVPEPSTLLLVAPAAIGLWRKVRK